MRFKLKIIFNLITLRLNRRWYASNLKRLRAKRWRKLQKTLQHSPFYRDLVAKKTPLEEYPLVNKALFMEHLDEINTVGVEREAAFSIALEAENSRDFSPMINGVTIGLSSGTSGNRGIFMASEDERARWVACVLDRVIGFSLRKRSVAFFLRANSNLYDSAKSKVLKFEFFDLLEPLDQQIDRLTALQPTYLVAQPSLLLELAACQEAGKIKLNPEKIISVAEVLYPEDAAYLEGVFGQTIHQVYQCTEGMLATTCDHGTLHFNEDFLVIEKQYLDDEKTRFHPVITDLMRTSQPVVRYELNDIVHEKHDCPCGSPMLGIAQIEGRSDDLLVFETSAQEMIKIFPDFFRRAIIMADPHIQDYTLLQTDLNQLNLFVNGTEELFEKAKTSILDFLHGKGVADVQVLRAENRHHDKGNKLRRIQNDYQ